MVYFIGQKLFTLRHMKLYSNCGSVWVIFNLRSHNFRSVSTNWKKYTILIFNDFSESFNCQYLGNCRTRLQCTMIIISVSPYGCFQRNYFGYHHLPLIASSFESRFQSTKYRIVTSVMFVRVLLCS